MLRLAFSLAAEAIRDSLHAPRMPLPLRALVAEARLACARAEIAVLRRQRDEAIAEVEREVAGIELEGKPLTDDDRSRIATVRSWLVPRFGVAYLVTFDRLLHRAGVLS